MWKEKALEVLRKNGYKLTPQRLKLVEILGEIGSEHPSIGRLLERIREDFPTVSFSTLYSNLITLKELGLVELFSIEGETRVELNTEPHINLINGDSIVDIDDPEIIEALKKRLGKEVKLVNVLVKE
ncbi:Fur family transcriptional regulator [Thermococcus peptonophilus]|uniref:Fur family transcriptional regulator n=1 Tax=Thermococcus peptonophilus TaxID=53952 RepID=A0A142CXF4_9EURY|nr:Fur family transcriptional regulator [Thermococcus peptonophilus]AMQ19456.1 Fur family transcriptional regulator [Thermococcus peptonophilus]